jgi:DNA-directed RNA polymerase subunit L
MASSSINISNQSEENNELRFVLSGVDVSIANAIRRTMLSDVPIVIFRAFGGESSDAIFTANTGRLNNEILSQRLSCIPIYIQPNDEEYNIADLLLELDEENTTDVLRVITTNDFKVRVISTGEHLSKQKCTEMFRPFQSMTGESYPIQFARLRQRISDEIPGEKISMTCKFSIGTASDNSMFNVVGTCAYGMTVDEATATDALNVKQQKWRADGMTEPLIESESLNWGFLDKKRITIPNSFDFVVGTVGPIPNANIVATSCQILVNRCRRIIETISNGLMVATSGTEYSVEYTLENEDYTIGCVLSHMLFKNYFENNQTITFCGFKKLHPHDTDGIIRIMFKSNDSDDSSSTSPPPLDTPPPSTVQRVPRAVAFDVSPPYSTTQPAGDSPPYSTTQPAGDSPPFSTTQPAGDSPPYSTTQGAFDVSDEDKSQASPQAKKILGGSRGGSNFKVIGFDYIKKCCNDAIEIFETIGQIINKK